MPVHDFRCQLGHVTEMFVAHGVDSIDCPTCKSAALEQSPMCGYEIVPVWLKASKVFLKFPAAFVQADVNYTSPVDGRVINSKHARQEDMARNNCIEYDPAMKGDYMKRLKESDDKLGREIEHHFDAELSAMPARKKELLEQELRSGADLEFTRSTA